MLFLFSSQWCQRQLFKNIRYLEKKHQITFKQQNQCSKFPTESCMQARRHRGHFGAVPPNLLFVPPPPKQEMCFPPSENCDPKKSTGPTPLRCICNKDLVFLVFTPKCEGKIRTKGSFCAPKRKCASQAKMCLPSENRAPKESNRINATGMYLRKRPFF